MSGFRQRVVRETHLGNITNSGYLLPARRDREKVNRYYLNYLMHEFCFTDILTREQKESLLTSFRAFGVIPGEVIDYRMSCLQGEDPGPPPPAVFDYPPPHWGGPKVTGGYFPIWTGRAYLPGETPADRIAKRWNDDPERYREMRPKERLTHAQEQLEYCKKMIASYESRGQTLYPEYAAVNDAIKAHIEFLKGIIREEKKAVRSKAQRKARKAA